MYVCKDGGMGTGRRRKVRVDRRKERGEERTSSQMWDVTSGFSEGVDGKKIIGAY